MARANYSYEKRGRELEKQKKKEEKRQKKLMKSSDPVEGEENASPSSEVENTPESDL